MKKRKSILLLLIIILTTFALLACKDDKATLESKEDEDIVGKEIESKDVGEDLSSLEKDGETEKSIENENLKTEKVKKDKKKKKLIYKYNPLFDQIYYEIVKNKTELKKDEIIDYIENEGYHISEEEVLGGYKISDDETEDYVYINFSDNENEYLENINYFKAENNLEVSWINLNEDRLKEYEKLQVHIPNYESFVVNDLQSQINFLKNKNPEDLKFDF